MHVPPAERVGRLDEQGKVYWHEAFYEALELEFYQYRDVLKFYNEHRLSEEALRIDVLVIKKDSDVQIEKDIGRIFKAHNLVEYKSEMDSFSVWDYNKVMGYAFLYSAFEQVPLADMTVSVVLTVFPAALVKHLTRDRGLAVRDTGKGIYHVEGEIVPVQLVESKKLPPNENLFLRNLRSNLSVDDILSTLTQYQAQGALSNKSVLLNRLIRANTAAFEEAMDMNEEVKTIFLDAAERNGWLEDRFVERRSIAKRLLSLGDSIEKVANATELSIETVESLA